MKKIFVLIACLALILCTAGVVSAEEGNGEGGDTTRTNLVQSQETVITYNLGSVYTLVIPDKFTIGSSVGHMTIEVADAVLVPNERINVTVSSDDYDATKDDGNQGHGLWTLTSTVDNDELLYYHIHVKNGNVETPIKKGGSVFLHTADEFSNLNVNIDVNTGVEKFSIQELLYLKLHDDVRIAGEFKGTLEFTSKVETYTPSQ